jgi:hypothetical protein
VGLVALAENVLTAEQLIASQVGLCFVALISISNIANAQNLCILIN